MKSADEVFLEYNNHGYDCKCGCQDGGGRMRAAMWAYAKKAIKEDREALVRHVSHKHKVYDKDFKIDKNSILNAPLPKLD